MWAAEEIGKRTNGRYKIEVLPGDSLGKERDINQGLRLGTVDIIYTGALFAGRFYGRSRSAAAPVHVPRLRPLGTSYGKSDVFQELAEGYKKATGNHVVTPDLLRRAPRHLEQGDH